MLIPQLAKKHPRSADALESEAKALLGISATMFGAGVNQLIDTEAALAHGPLTVNRLRRIGASRNRRAAA
jgi:hypothetical protein